MTKDAPKVAEVKYPRTYHFTFSPGATKDDKIAKDINGILGKEVVITEKMDGSNVCLEKEKCFARSHSGSPTHESFDMFKAIHAGIKFIIPDSYQIFGEWCYAQHTIFYDSLPNYLLIFGVREINQMTWLSWDDVEYWAEQIGASTVPLLERWTVSNEKELQEKVELLSANPSTYGKEKEGVVVKLAGRFSNDDFDKSVIKRVRAGHVNANDEHWLTKDIVKNLLKENRV
jgi:hypothetical protein